MGSVPSLIEVHPDVCVSSREDGVLAINQLRVLEGWSSLARCALHVRECGLSTALSEFNDAEERIEMASALLGFDCSHLRGPDTLWDEIGRAPLSHDSDFSCIIRDTLFLSSIGTARNYNFLLERKITHIVNVTTIDEMADDLFLYLHLPIEDVAESRLPFTEARFFVDEAIQNGGRVLVHCEAGVSRSSSIVMGILIGWGFPPKQAAIFVRQRRPQVRPNPSFISQLASLWPVEAEQQVFVLHYLREVFPILVSDFISDSLIIETLKDTDMDVVATLRALATKIDGQKELISPISK